MNTLDYALAYLHRGWSIIPLKPRSKEPAAPIKDFLNGWRTMDEASARSYWECNPDHGIGIVTGKPSGIVVIDIDPRNGGDLGIANEVGSDLVQTTGGGGLHVICAYPGEPTPCGKTTLPGVDRKGDGGYIVAAPSIHPNGQKYYWRTEPTTTFADGSGSAWLLGDAVPMPAWVVERRHSEMSSSGDTEPWVANALASPETVAPGGQEDLLTRLCWWAARHLDYDIALGLLTGWVKRLPLGNPHDPWGPEHVISRLDRAMDKREPDPGYVSGIVDDVAATRSAKTSAKLRDMVRNAPTFIAEAEQDAASREWIAEDFVAPGCWTEIIGVMKEGKTTFVCGLLNAILSGEEYLGRKCKKARVLYVTEQVGLSFQKTLERGGLTQSEDLFILTIGDTFGTPWADVSASLIDIAVELGCTVIVVDTLARLAGIADEDEAKSVTVLNPLLGARAKGIAVMFVRHSRKSGGAINVAGRGSGAITGEMDICLQVTAPEGVKSDYRHLEGVSRLTDTIEAHLAYEGGRYVIGADPAEQKREHRHAPVVQYLSAQGMKFTKHGDMVDALKDTMPKTTLTRYLNELVEANVVEKTAEGYRLRPAPAVTGVA